MGVKEKRVLQTKMIPLGEKWSSVHKSTKQSNHMWINL